MILWEKSDCSPDWTELLSILADLAKLTEKCSKNCGLLPKVIFHCVLRKNVPLQSIKQSINQSYTYLIDPSFSFLSLFSSSSISLLI